MRVRANVYIERDGRTRLASPFSPEVPTQSHERTVGFEFIGTIKKALIVSNLVTLKRPARLRYRFNYVWSTGRDLFAIPQP